MVCYGLWACCFLAFVASFDCCIGLGDLVVLVVVIVVFAWIGLVCGWALAGFWWLCDCCGCASGWGCLWCSLCLRSWLLIAVEFGCVDLVVWL